MCVCCLVSMGQCRFFEHRLLELRACDVDPCVVSLLFVVVHAIVSAWVLRLLFSVWVRVSFVAEDLGGDKGNKKNNDRHNPYEGQRAEN